MRLSPNLSDCAKLMYKNTVQSELCVIMSSTLLAASSPAPRLLDLVRKRVRVKHYSLRTELVYIKWIKDHVFFYGKQHIRGTWAR